MGIMAAALAKEQQEEKMEVEVKLEAGVKVEAGVKTEAEESAAAQRALSVCASHSLSSTMLSLSLLPDVLSRCRSLSISLYLLSSLCCSRARAHRRR